MVKRLYDLLSVFLSIPRRPRREVGLVTLKTPGTPSIGGVVTRDGTVGGCFVCVTDPLVQLLLVSGRPYLVHTRAYYRPSESERVVRPETPRPLSDEARSEVMGCYRG